MNAGFYAFAAPCDTTGTFYTCNDGKKHTIKNKTYNLKSLQEQAPGSAPNPDSAPIKAIYVEKVGTVVNASQITVTGDSSSQIFTYGAYVKYGARLNLKDSNFKNVRALYAENAVIGMTDGSITETSHAIYAVGAKTDIPLVRVKIEIEPDNLQDIGFVSRLGAKIRMSGGDVTFNGKGTFSSLYGGGYAFDSTVIKGKGKQKTVIVDEESVGKLPEVFDASQGSNIQLNNSSIEISDMHGFLVNNSSVDVNDKGKLLWQAFSSSDEFKKTNINIKKTNISVQGKGTYGLYFYGLEPDEWFRVSVSANEKLLKDKNVIRGKASVQLSQTNFTVPEGIAVYNTGDDGFGAKATLELLEDTKISGDLLLKAENNSSLLVKAYSSTLTGGIRTEDTARIALQLRNSSTWYLTKSQYQGLQEATVSSLSTLSLFDSTLVFEKYVSQDYQTLHIGNRIYNRADSQALDDIDKTAGMDDVGNKVYSAGGNSRIKMSTFMNNDGSFDPKKTDRILIYGDVAGTTLIELEKFQKTSDEKVIDESHQSVSIIQVFGEAKENTFKLLSDYVAVNGFPYRYHLRAYGPASSFGKADPKNRLVAGEGNFWDFRLESVYIDPEIGGSSQSVSVLSIKPTSTILPPKPEAETMPSEQLSETISPEQPPSVEPSLIPSISSVSEVSEPSETFIPTDSSFTPSTSVPLVPTSVPTAAENSSAVKPMPASFVSIETSTDEVLPSDPSASSSADSVSVPSTVVELQPSTSSGSLDTSANFLVSLDVQPEQKIRAVVPQVPTYLLLTNTLFHAGLMDMTAQNKTLMTMRNAFHSSWKDNEQTAFFLHAYGGSHHYTSNLSSFEYGYGAELDYTAFEVGILLNEIENSQNRTFFGVLGNYGNLSLYPQNVEQSKESAFDKWSVAAYGSLQHDAGFYIDGVLSYSLLKGDVLTLARGKVVALKGKQFSGSLTSGRTFAIGYKDIVFDPQVQVVYQHLQFNPARDIDDLEVNLGKFHQWVGRVGGRLSKMLNVSEGGRVVSFYSKLSYLHSFEDKQFVSFKKDFQLGAFGSSLEAGLGFNARLSSKLSLYGDMTYQHKLKKVGFSGTSFSIRLHYHF
ncbi:outer membrane autotransporter protein [Bartonella fuyuanensis]|uniref:Outer membrane autotransporter protein n=2 Tax=Bartonella fuyuanensis TaxID=1460968 RepID=A0A840DUU4_9HYPH|nr:outer membrane autotransporter protein [Bartonella fuyuanensis]